MTDGELTVQILDAKLLPAKKPKHGPKTLKVRSIYALPAQLPGSTGIDRGAKGQPTGETP